MVISFRKRTDCLLKTHFLVKNRKNKTNKIKKHVLLQGLGRVFFFFSEDSWRGTFGLLSGEW